jgi:hypothetical protein
MQSPKRCVLKNKLDGFSIKTRRWIMFKNITFLLMYHRHKLLYRKRNIGLQYVKESYLYKEETVIFEECELHEYVQHNHVAFSRS